MLRGERITPFLPSKHGWHFLNDFRLCIKILGLKIGNWGIYFCGGMCFNALKRYRQKKPISPDTIPPQQGTALYKEIFDNQINLTIANIIKIYDYQTRFDKSYFSRRPGLGYKTKQEWQKLKDSLDTGKPVLMGIIRAEGRNPFQLTHNHWVIAWRYSYEADKKAANIWVYDPNFPDSDDGYIRFNFAFPDDRIDPWYSRGDKVRGFFVLTYQGFFKNV